VDKAVSALGGVDILVNNAAHQASFKELEDISEEEWDLTFKVNIHAMFYLTKAAVPHMKPGSAIINTASINSDMPNPTLLAYATTKGAIQNFTAGLAQLLAPKGIRANAVAPGPIWTPLIPSTMPEEAVINFGKQVPMKRPGQPAELASAYVMLAEPISSYVSGATIAVTAGGQFYDCRPAGRSPQLAFDRLSRRLRPRQSQLHQVNLQLWIDGGVGLPGALLGALEAFLRITLVHCGTHGVTGDLRNRQSTRRRWVRTGCGACFDAGVAAAIFLHPLLGTRRNESHYGSRKAQLDGRDPMSKSAKDFEEFARDCVRLAEQADTPALREKLFGLAREWMKAVMDVEDAETRTGK
jgi:Enoyl-(Acyl carrier protein) reductase